MHLAARVAFNFLSGARRFFCMNRSGTLPAAGSIPKFVAITKG
jgi:hypothetical protein